MRWFRNYIIETNDFSHISCFLHQKKNVFKKMFETGFENAP